MITRLAMLVIAMVVVCTVGTPRSAEAARYFWMNVNDGNWNNSANWDNVDDSDEDPNNDGLPNAPGDEAHFTLAYTKPHTVGIPAAGVTVGAIYFNSHFITINAAPGGVLRMQQAPPAAAVILRLDPTPFGTDTINAPIVLQSNLDITNHSERSWITFNNSIANNLGIFGITKLGKGRINLRAVNSYLGATAVEGGVLYLADAAAPSIRRLLTVGPITRLNPIDAEVVVDSPNQIADDATVEVKAGGRLSVNAHETIGATTVNGGVIFISGVQQPSAALSIASLSMTGGEVLSGGGGIIHLPGGVTATSGPDLAIARIARVADDGVLNLGSGDRMFDVRRGSSASGVDLTIGIPIAGAGGAGVIKQGDGMMVFTLENTYVGATQVKQGELQVRLPLVGGTSLRGPVNVGNGSGAAVLTLMDSHVIADAAPVNVGANGTLNVLDPEPEIVGALGITSSGRVRIGAGNIGAGLIASALTMRGGRVEMTGTSSLLVNGPVDVSSVSAANGTPSALIEGGRLLFGGERTIVVPEGPADTDAIIAAVITGAAAQGITKAGQGTLTFAANHTYGGATTIAAGRLNINSNQPANPVIVTGGILGGKGTAGLVNVPAGGAVSPGDLAGRLSTGSIAFTSGSSFSLFLEGSGAGQYGQLAVTGAVALGGAAFAAGTRANLSPEASYLIIDNDGADPVVGTFAGLPEGREIEIGGVIYAITYRGGDGNDVVIEGEEPVSTTYYLAEGATGDFFDDDVLIANPNDVQAPVKLTFLREGGATVTLDRVIPANARVTIHVDQLEGLQDVSASVKVESIDRLPLIVERSMFWDQSYYGGHTANAVSKPEKRWTFAEGSQGGFFDTYILIANANAVKTTATLTFLRENEPPVVKTLEIDPFARKTIHTREYDELKDSAFGVVVEATEPVIAERSMYFASLPGRPWAGGHVNTGTVAPSQSWFHAEGATGTFFNTFILLSNPQDTQAKVDVKFLLDTGEVIARPKTLEPKQRMTINPAAEGDPRLTGASVSTVVQSDVPIVSERSMYWEGDVENGIGEGHNSSGITETALRWGLAEGRLGGARNFVTYILLANPGTAKANVRITYLRESGAPIVKEYEVAATSRFNVDVKSVVPELQNSSFGAIIEVLNDVPIAVERSLYWDANGAFWAGGTNALATPLPPIE